MSEKININLEHCGQYVLDEEHIFGWFHPIPLKTWKAILGFHQAAARKFNGESITLHRWNPGKKDYDTIIPYQETVPQGLSVTVNWQDERNKEFLDEYARENGMEFFPACSIHTHVNIEAFESGTDAKDEEDWAGWHLTIGKMFHKELDLFGRYRLPKIPKVKNVTDVEDCYVLPWKFLFPKGADETKIVDPVGSDDFLKFVERVETPFKQEQFYPGVENKVERHPYQHLSKDEILELVEMGWLDEEQARIYTGMPMKIGFKK